VYCKMKSPCELKKA